MKQYFIIYKNGLK